METKNSTRGRTFVEWLRTGRLPSSLSGAPAEFKFNPWHDPEDGRFTFAGRGKYYGRGQRSSLPDSNDANHSKRREGADSRGRAAASYGGGQSGGGGATGSYGDGNSSGARSTSGPHAGGRSGGGGASESYGGYSGGGGFNGGGAGGSYGGGRSGGGGASGSWDSATDERSTQAQPKINPRIARRAEQENWRRVEQNGYAYFIDRRGRTRYVSGTITENAVQPRSRANQATAGTPDRRPSDHGGHYIARRFNGPTEAFNHFAQDANFNRSGYLALENQWARAKGAGSQVEVRIEPVFHGASQRPSYINVWFSIDGRRQSQKFPNEPGRR